MGLMGVDQCSRREEPEVIAVDNLKEVVDPQEGEKSD